MRLSGVTYYGTAPRVAAVTSSLPVPPPVIIIHDTGNSSASKEDEAHFAATRTDAQDKWTAAHFYVDDNGVLGSLDLDRVAWSAYHWANHNGWHIEMCGMDAGDAHAVTAKTIANTAALVKALTGVGHQTIQHLGPSDIAALANGTSHKTGITGHRDITLSNIDQNTHSDPGAGFDWGHFIGLVNQGVDMALKDDIDFAFMFPRVEAIALRQPPGEGSEKGVKLPVLKWMDDVEANTKKAADAAGAPVPVTVNAAEVAAALTADAGFADDIAERVAVKLAARLQA